MVRQKSYPAKKLGGSEPEPTARYRCLVGGRQRFHGTEPGNTVDLELTERRLAQHVGSGVVAEYELLDVEHHEPEVDAVDLESGHPSDSVHATDAAVVFVHDEGDEPDLDLSDER